MNLSSVNLNHLVALDALLREESVGRAAVRTGITQSAMSHTLRALRELLGDPLLVRVGNEMRLTPFAEATRDRLQRGLGELEGVLSGRAAFQPEEVETTFTLAANDGTAAILAASLYSELHQRAPKARLRIQHVDIERLPDQLADGQIDLAMVPPILEIRDSDGEPLEGKGTTLATMSVVSRREHPGIGKRLSLPRYCGLSHAMLSLSGEGGSFIDHLLAERGLSRNVEVRVPYLVALAELITHSDLVTTTISAIARFYCKHWPLQMHALPLPLALADMELRWHPRFASDASHLFFRDVVRKAIRTVTERY